MSEVREWLKGIGLGQYADVFDANEIDMDLLSRVDDQMLKDIGVSVGGHRLRIRKAIDELKAEHPSDANKHTASPSTAEPVSAERRQVTVMFSDLVGSTALSARMDPEDLRDLIGAYQKCVAETVRRFDGFVAKYLGDGGLVYFGYPQAHEDDAERAVRAGLELVATVIALKSPMALQTRVGIATGLVVVGDLIKSEDAVERGIVGETPNLAARLQSIAEPNTVVIGESTRRLLGNLFELEDLGPRDLKGIAGPTQAWAALRPSTVASRFEALHGAGLTELVGREEEVELLLRRWAKAKAGEGQVALISGEPGIGKSRLTAALLERILAEPHIRLRYFCSPQHTDSALYPIIGQIERAAGLTRDDALRVRLDKLDAVLALTSTAGRDAALFAEMLSLPNDGRYPVLELASDQRRQRTLEALMAQVARLTSRQPVLMLFEDAHWIDPTSLDVLGRVVSQIEGLRVLLIVTFRPEFDPPWIGRPYVTAVTINRLTRREVDTMIGLVPGVKLLPAKIQQNIVERSDGIPLFIEETTRAVLEAAGEAQQTAASMPSRSLSVPASLHASLMARLDRLGPAREVAQVGAAIGREFPHSLLAAVECKTEAELQSALDRLIAAGLVSRQGLPPDVSYLFKHALVQEVAYGTLLREPRRALHARITEAFESHFPEIMESQPELLARHCTEAGQIEKAASFWAKAGLRSLDRSALVEATEQLTRALAQMAHLPSTPALRSQQIKLQAGLANALMHTKGYAAPETKAALDKARSFIERAEAAAELPEDPLLLFSVLYGAWATHYVAFSGNILCDLAAQFLTLAEKQQAAAPLLVGYRLLATSLLFTGNIKQARTHYDTAIGLYKPSEHGPLAGRFGQDPGVSILSGRSWALWMLGYPEAARADSERIICQANEIGQTTTLMFALGHVPFTHVVCGRYAEAAAQAHQLAALAQEKGALFWKAHGMMHQGCVLGLNGQPAHAVKAIASGIAEYQSRGSTAWLPWFQSHLAIAHAELGEFDAARSQIAEAQSLIEATGQRCWEAEARRIAGQIALISPEHDLTKAESYFDRALTAARAQQAKSWELRAAMSMARLWRDQGKRQQAHDLLAPVYGWFTEGFDTLDLRQAKALLNELA
jgi:class 3 adenylate cyclase/predicted ATPase